METVAKQSNFVSAKSISLPIYQRYSRAWMTLMLVLSDLSSLVIAVLLALLVRLSVGRPALDLDYYLHLLPVIFGFLIAYGLAGLYPSVGLNPVEELRRLTLITSVTFLFFVGITFWVQVSGSFSRVVLTLFWGFAVLGVPLTRWLVRRAAVRAHAWGESIAVIGCGPQTHHTIQFLKSNPHLGLIPVVVVNGFDKTDQHLELVQVLDFDHLKQDPAFLHHNNIHTAVIVPTETPASFQSLIVDERHYGLQRLILISSLGWVGGSAVTPYDLHGILGLEIQRKLLNPTEQASKRLLDLLLVTVGGALIFPLLGLITLLIRLETGGGSFYGHKRIGIDGKEFKVWKFRTMVANADQLLDRCFADNPQLRAEWEAAHKLRDDPRITRIGKFLRRSSLDELPQLWNVLKGEMCLVGPRPIMLNQKKSATTTALPPLHPRSPRHHRPLASLRPQQNHLRPPRRTRRPLRHALVHLARPLHPRPHHLGRPPPRRRRLYPPPVPSPPCIPLRPAVLSRPHPPRTGGSRAALFPARSSTAAPHFLCGCTF